MRAARFGLLLLAAGLAAGCGFQLRGDVELSARMQTPYVEAADRHTTFYGELKAALVGAGAALSPSSQTASAIVHIHRDLTGRRVLTISARNTPQEYEVFYTVEYSVSSAGKEILPRQKLTLTREYAYDDAAMLAKQHEEDDIRASLARELAALVARRVSAL
jgi:LPS-assembly lipoprotein